MLIRMNQRGEGKLGCLFGLVILAAVLFVAYKMIPVKVKAAEMRDTITDEARSAGGRSVDEVRKQIIQKAIDLDLPILDSQLTIDRRSDYIKVDVEYTVPVKFPGYTYQWHFQHHAENPVF